MAPGVVTLYVIGGVFLLGLLWFAGTYNRLVRLRNLVRESWSDVLTELKRRYDLIPNLVRTVEGYVAHEREIMDAVTQAHALATGASGGPAAQAQAEEGLTRALRQLFALVENYPQLRAAENFTQLQQELANTEDRIQASRRFYNANVRDNNVAIESFPSSIVAGMFSFAHSEFFEADLAVVGEAPQVSFK